MEQNNDTLIDLSFDEMFGANDFVVNNEESLWDKLIQQIVNGNVIPVIGADMLIDAPVNLHQKVIEYLAHGFHLTSKPKSFSELIYDPAYSEKNKDKIDSIYYHVNTLFANKSFVGSKRLERLLSIRQFPFVITTSFTPVVEQVMKSIWKNVQVMRFNNNPKENQDIKNSADMYKPTVYYMFGKVGDSAHHYVLTDTDMLDFVSSWLSGDNKSRPKILCGELENKYLLMLGNNYSDWLFRFIWYSMHKPKVGMLAYDKLDDELINFLERTETFTKQNTSAVIDQIVSRVEKKLKEQEEAKKLKDKEETIFDKPEENTDIFISYSRSDSAIAERLYDSLTKQGMRVWYDKHNITAGGHFWEEIVRAIDTSKYFIPILTQNITKEMNDKHVYRKEWLKAIDVANSLGRTYIIPLSTNDFEFYQARVPEGMQKHNAVLFSSEEDLEQAVLEIINKINQN